MNPNCFLFQELANNADAFQNHTFGEQAHQTNAPGIYNHSQHGFPQHMPNNYSNRSRGYRKRPYGNNTTANRGGKRFKTENFIDFCDVCDRGFKTQEKKEEHFSQHTKVCKGHLFVFIWHKFQVKATLSGTF